MKVRAIILALGLIGMAIPPVWAQGPPIARHFGSVDPTSEGFVLSTYGNALLGPVTDDLGRDAWSINMQSPGLADYSQTFTDQQQADAVALGWTLSATLRILAPYRSGNAVYFGTEVGSFQLQFSAQPNGDPIVTGNGFRYVLGGGGTGYHNYELEYDPTSNSASFWVDGSERLAGIPGSQNVSTAVLLWGQGQGGFANANWNEVSLTVVPEPSPTALLSLGVLVSASPFFQHLLDRRNRLGSSTQRRQREPA